MTVVVVVAVVVVVMVVASATATAIEYAPSTSFSGMVPPNDSMSFLIGAARGSFRTEGSS